MGRSICIVGFAPETRELANSQPPEVEMWGMNVNNKFMNRYDRWFQLHPPVWHNKPFYGRTPEHWEFLRTCGVPLYMKYPSPELPTSVEYPLEAVYENIGRRYLTSTSAHLIALAIYEGVDEIKMFGVNLASNTEYVEQRPCVEWLLGLAEGRGIKVEVPKDSPILDGLEYPGEYQTSPREVAQQRLDGRREVYNKYWAKVHQNVGALHALKVLAESGKTVEELEREYQNNGEQVLEHLQQMRGKITECKFWLGKSGGFDRHASIMPHMSLPKGVFPPNVTKMLEETNVG